MKLIFFHFRNLFIKQGSVFNIKHAFRELKALKETKTGSIKLTSEV
jgi:hypothetical protein